MMAKKTDQRKVFDYVQRVLAVPDARALESMQIDQLVTEYNGKIAALSLDLLEAVKKIATGTTQPTITI